MIAPMPDLTPSEQQEREESILGLVQLVKNLAVRLCAKLPDTVSQEDLISAGVIGLIDAVDRYDDSRGCSLKSYASLRIHGAMVDELRRQDWVPRSVHRDQRLFSQASDRLGQRFGREATDEELRTELNLSPDRFELLSERISSPILVSFDAASEDHEGNPYDLFDSTAAADQPLPFERLLVEDDIHVMRECLEMLPLRHKTVLSLHYLEQVRLRDIAFSLSVTESRVSQIHSEALRMLLTEFSRCSE